jgi:hypothetical protein
VHYGDRIAFENTLGADTTLISYRIVDRSDQTLGHVRGSLAMGHATSGIRLSGAPVADVVQFFARGGVSWTWYRVLDATVAGTPTYAQDERGGHWPSLLPSKKWWPNSTYIGVGSELFAPRPLWLFGTVGYGVRFELSVLSQPLRGPRCSCISRRQDASISLQLGW